MKRILALVIVMCALLLPLCRMNAGPVMRKSSGGSEENELCSVIPSER